MLDERPVTVAARSVGGSGDPAQASSDAREFLVRYEQGETLGQGGMGEVRLCKDQRIGREVAMKVIRPEHGSRDDLRSRFLREVQVQGQLEHPSIVPVYDLGVGADGNTYFTMKRVRGFTLADILDKLRAEDAVPSPIIRCESSSPPLEACAWPSSSPTRERSSIAI